MGNLAYSTTEDALRQLFAQVGSVATCDLIRDRDTGQSKGFAFVTMGSQAEAETATHMFNAYALDDRALTVNPARPREERRPFGERSQSRSGGRRR